MFEIQICKVVLIGYSVFIKEFILENIEGIDILVTAVRESVFDFIKKNDQQGNNEQNDILHGVQHNPRSNSVILALQGDLGAGKTTFTKALAKSLGIEDQITSPTFVILKKYKIDQNFIPEEFKGRLKNLVHIDAYRLTSGIELQKIGFETYLQNNLICIEWPELVEDIMPKTYIQVTIEHFDDPQEADWRKVKVQVIER